MITLELSQLKDLFQNYRLDSFVGTPNSILINEEQIQTDIERAFSDRARTYLENLSDLTRHNNEFFSNNEHVFSNYLLRLVGTTSALKDLIELGEDVSNIFENDITWSKGLAFRAMITILDNIIEELKKAGNQVRNSRNVNRVRDKISFIISQKIPQVFYILTTLIAIDIGQISPNEIISAIGKGMQAAQTCSR